MTDFGPRNVSDIPCPRGVDSLREFVRGVARNGAKAPRDDLLRASARLMCDDARARGVRVEELLVSLKQTWPRIAEGERIARPESSRLLARVVTVCVQEYYAPSG